MADKNCFCGRHIKEDGECVAGHSSWEIGFMKGIDRNNNLTKEQLCKQKDHQ